MNFVSFGGDKKVGAAISNKLEKKFINWAVPLVPRWIRSHHLTLASLPISALIVFFSFLAHWHIEWLWAVSFLIFMQWLTDSLDGAVGRTRNEGLVRWGYYMDHFLDYIFLASIILGYALLFPVGFIYVQLFVLVILSSFMVNSFLSFGATNNFQVAYCGIGPTEIRLVFIMTNTLLILFGRTFMAGLLPYVLILEFFGLCVVVYRTQKEIWAIDMANKQAAEAVEARR